MEVNKVVILLVDDSQIYLKATAKLLQDAGFEVVQASDGEEAIALLEAGRSAFDAIVTDLIMPKVSGAIIAKLNHFKYHLPIVVVTGTGDSSVSLELLKYGVENFVLKPFDGKSFIKVLTNVIGRNLAASKSIDEGRYDGNVSKITISAKRKNLNRASDWIAQKVENSLEARDVLEMIGYLNEFLLNAYEHGSLNIAEEAKGTLLKNGGYDSELAKREKRCDLNIKVELSVLDDEVAVKISDEGKGFAFQRYLNFTNQDILERLSKPNGRGIFMAKSYFDLVKYGSGGSSVLLTKTLN